jgi:integrase
LGRNHLGQRVRVHDVVYGTRKDAQRYLTDKLKRRDDGLPVALSHETLGEWVKEWLANWTGTKSPRSRADAVHVWRRIFEYDTLLGGVKLTALSPERVQRFIAQLQSTKKRKQVSGKGWVETDALLAPRTIRIYHGALRHVMNEALRLGKVSRNVVSLVRAPALVRADRNYLTAEQAEQFLAASAGDRFHALWSVLLLGGLRPGEACALKWSDVDGETLRVQRALVWLSGAPPMFEAPKNGKARTIALGDRLVKILQRHRVAQAKWRLQMGASWEDQDLLFTTETGRPLHVHNIVVRHFKPLLKKAKLPNLRLYDLRHTHATLLLAAGEHPKVVQERLGHSSITLTLDVYSHVVPGMQEKAAERLDALLASTKAAGAARA